MSQIGLVWSDLALRSWYGFFYKNINSGYTECDHAPIFLNSCKIQWDNIFQPKKSKIYRYVFSGQPFFKIGAIYQNRPNQTKPAQVVYYILLIIVRELTTKNFSSLGPTGAEIQDPESSISEKCQFQVFLKKGPQGPPKRSKINFFGIFGYQGPTWGPKKILVDFRDGVS